MGRQVVGELERREVGGKPVYIAESHHMVLEAWAELRRSLSTTPHVVTLDFHTDLRECFVGAACDAHSAAGVVSQQMIESHRKPLVTKLATLDPAEVRAMIELLTYEEHIHAGQQAGIIDHVFLAQSDGAGYKAGNNQHILQKDTWDKAEADSVLEPAFLDMLVQMIEMTVGKLDAAPYILDIDLDFFRTAKALQPDDPSTFHRLIQNAQIITVALEPRCVEGGCLPGETITSASLLADLIGQIEAATRQPHTPSKP